MNKTAFSACAGAVILLALAAPAPAQFANDGFDPNADGTIRAVVVQPDGKTLIGGDFTTLTPNGGPAVARHRIARLNPDGSVDTAFNPQSDGIVTSIALQADGKILVAGYFNVIGGQPRNYVARLDPVTGAADSFNPNANFWVTAVAVQADGKILVGGSFDNIGGQPRNRIARLDAATAAADSFNPNASSSVDVIVLQPDGKILVSGFFATIGSQTRSKIARLDPSTGTADSFNPNANEQVYAMALQADGKILVGGAFTSIGGQARPYIARLNPTTGAAESFNPTANSQVRTIVVQRDGRILVGGLFTSVGGQTRNRLARLAPANGAPDSFNPDVSFSVLAIATQPSGKVLVGGQFTAVAGQTRNNIARLETDGRLDRTLNLNLPSFQNDVYVTAIQPDGKILIGGYFTSVLGQARTHIARLHSDGTLDSFNPGANNEVTAIAVQADGRILVAGPFTSIGGQPRNGIARLHPDGSVDTAFNPNASFVGSPAMVLALAVQSDGKILVGGDFTSIGGQTRTFIARLDAVSGAADSFNPNANDNVNCFAVLPGGKILVGGEFTGIGGQTRNRIARLDPTTGAADSFNPQADAELYSLTLQPDGKVLVSGFFSSIGGQPRSKFARLTNDTPALQNLAVSHTAVSWARGGSSPQFARVTFESSTDNINYTLLGHATSSGRDWHLAGLNFPTQQNLYIRARGFYQSGAVLGHGSESIQETVRNVFIPVPPTPTQVVSRKLHNSAPFDLNLPLTGTPGVECRSGGASNDHQIVLSFPNTVTLDRAAVTSGAGSVSSASASGTQIFVNLTGVTNAQTITVTLFGASDGTATGNLDVPMSLLIGDSNGDRVVNVGDVQQTKNRSGQVADGTNFRSDFNTEGNVNVGDALIARSRSGQFIP